MHARTHARTLRDSDYRYSSGNSIKGDQVDVILLDSEKAFDAQADPRHRC